MSTPAVGHHFGSTYVTFADEPYVVSQLATCTAAADQCLGKFPVGLISTHELLWADRVQYWECVPPLVWEVRVDWSILVLWCSLYCMATYGSIGHMSAHYAEGSYRYWYERCGHYVGYRYYHRQHSWYGYCGSLVATCSMTAMGRMGTTVIMAAQLHAWWAPQQEPVLLSPTPWRHKSPHGRSSKRNS